MAELTRTELVARLEEAHDQQRAISAVLRAVVASGGLQPVLDEIVAAAKTLCGAEHAQLYLLDGDVFLIRAGSEDTEAGYAFAEAHPHPFDRTTVVGRVGLARDVVQIPDVLEDPEYTFGAQSIVGFRALLGVPIMLDGELIGVVGGRNVPGPFTPEQVELVKKFADQAAIAITNTRLIEAVERQRAELSRFLAAGRRARHVGAGPAGPGRPPGVHLLPVLRPARVHRVRGDSGARGALRGAARLPRAARRADRRTPRDARAFRRRRRHGLLQRPGRGTRARAGGRPPGARRAERFAELASAWPSGGSSSPSGSASRPATPRSGASASRAATTTALSARSRTWPRGSARTPSPARS